MSDVTVEIHLEELKRKFRAAGPELAARVLEQSLNEGGAVIEKAVRLYAEDHVKTGDLIADLHIEVAVAPDGLSGQALIGFRDQSHKAGWVEFGHRQVTHGLLKSDRKEVGHVPAHPFMRPGFDESQAAAKETVTKMLAEGVKEIK